MWSVGEKEGRPVWLLPKGEGQCRVGWGQLGRSKATVGHGKESDFVLGMMAQERATEVPSERVGMLGYSWPLSQLGLTR